MSKRVHIVMPEELVARIDRAAAGTSRGEYVRRAVERSLATAQPTGVVAVTPAPDTTPLTGEQRSDAFRRATQ